MRRLALLALAAAACSSGARNVGARFSGPTAIVAFAGYLQKGGLVGKPGGPGLRDYMAVASTRADELIILDPSDEQPVLSPGSVFALSIPTLPSPVKLAAASLGDRGAGGADLLAAMSEGSLLLQVANTWDPNANTMLPAASAADPPAGPASVDLSTLVPRGTLVLSLAALTPPGAVPGAPAARVLVAVREPPGSATASELLVVDFTRDASGAVVRSGAVQRQVLAFDAVDLAVSPDAGTVFAATPDAITTATFGVAQITMTQDASAPWRVDALDAHAPTLAVAAALVRERTDFTPTATSPSHFEDSPELRAYAILDANGAAGCGPLKQIVCGVATLVPASGSTAGGLAPDPAQGVFDAAAALGNPPPSSTPAQAFRQPMQVPALPVAVAVAAPPAAGPDTGPGRFADPQSPGQFLQQVAAGTVSPLPRTTSVGAVTATDGRIYLLDLGRFSPVNEVTSLAATITSATTSAGTAQIGLFSDFPSPNTLLSPPSPPAVLVDPASLPSLVQITPGFTPLDSFQLTWQGVLPQLSSRAGTLVDATHVNLSGGVNITSAELGVQQGDLVGLLCADGTTTSNTTVSAAPDPSTTALEIGASAPCAPGPVTVTIRSQALLLTSNSLGQLMAVVKDASGALVVQRPQFGSIYSVQWQPEDTVCPSDPTVTPTDQACIQLRKARRVYYPVEAACAASGTACFQHHPYLVDPLAPGPLVAFKAGLFGDPAAQLAQGQQLTFATLNGMVQGFRKPVTAGALPQQMVVFDRTKFDGHETEPIRIYATFLDDQVVSFTPAEPTANARSIR